MLSKEGCTTIVGNGKEIGPYIIIEIQIVQS